ncbi:hypothetical protein D3C76_1733190 [compost metagenome]
MWDSEEFRQKLLEAKKNLKLLAGDPGRTRWKELYAMGIITPLLDELGADPAVIVGGARGSCNCAWVFPFLHGNPNWKIYYCQHQEVEV